MIAGRNKQKAENCARPATVLSFVGVRSFMSSATKNMFWWHVNAKINKGNLEATAMKEPVGLTLVGPNPGSMKTMDIKIT